MDDVTQLQDAKDGVHMGACWGHWDMSAPECRECMVATNCEKASKMRQRKHVPPPVVEMESNTEPTETPTIDPINYLRESLSGKFDCEERKSGKADGWKWTKDGSLKFVVMVSKSSGHVMLRGSKGQKIVERLDDVGHVEKLVAELL